MKHTVSYKHLSLFNNVLVQHKKRKRKRKSVWGQSDSLSLALWDVQCSQLSPMTLVSGVILNVILEIEPTAHVFSYIYERHLPTGRSAGLGVSSDSSWNTNPPHRSAEDHRQRQTRWLRILYNEAATWGRSWASTWCQREQVTGLMQKNVWGWGVSASTYKNKIFPCVGATRPCGISRAHYRGKQQ